MKLSAIATLPPAAILALSVTACSTTAGEPPTRLQMANPASAYCVSLGGKVEIRKTATGDEYGICHLPDGSVVEEWTLFRRDHKQP